MRLHLPCTFYALDQNSNAFVREQRINIQKRLIIYISPGILHSVWWFAPFESSFPSLCWPNASSLSSIFSLSFSLFYRFGCWKQNNWSLMFVHSILRINNIGAFHSFSHNEWSHNRCVGKNDKPLYTSPIYLCLCLWYDTLACIRTKLLCDINKNCTLKKGKKLNSEYVKINELFESSCSASRFSLFHSEKIHFQFYSTRYHWMQNFIRLSFIKVSKHFIITYFSSRKWILFGN